MNQQQDKIRNSMLDPGFYPGSVDHVDFIETHISQVFLTGKHAYKIKKPVDFGFLDFTDLNKRKFYCEEELRLNGRLAPDIYLDVIPITISHNQLFLDGEGKVIEYAVKMKQFDQSGLLNNLITENRLTADNITQLADVIASFHQNIAQIDPASDLGNPEEVLQPVVHNFEILRPVANDNQREKLKHIENYCLSLHQHLENTFIKRKTKGFIRECHGDLHLGNITLINDRPVPFDGIEFNESLRWIDTMSEIAFLTMDLEDHQQKNYASQFINRYLEITGDYSGLGTLKYYKIYRAMVRAKVTGLRLTQLAEESEEFTRGSKELDNYLELAEQYCKPGNNCILITHGISGSGKSWIANKLTNQINAIRISSDRERKRLYSSKEDELYTRETTDKVYSYLADCTENIIKSGYNAIVDATFLNPEYRKYFRDLACSLNVKFFTINCIADEKLLKARLKERSKDKTAISDADISIMRKQLGKYKPIEKLSNEKIITIDTAKTIDFDSIVKQLTGCTD